MDGKAQSPKRLKSFRSGITDTALPLLDFGSAHKPGKKENTSKLRKKAKKHRMKHPLVLSKGLV